jgi:RimJ/RimL family protein N-acetyltransferase
MQHNLTMEGYAFRLRPVDNDDAAFIVELRSNPALNRFLHASSTCVKDQLAWLATYYERGGDYYFVVERKDNGQSEGLISIYDIDPRECSGYWGRWILRPGSLAAVESVWLIFRVAFELLELDSIYSRTVAENKKVVSFHDSYSLGRAERKLLPLYFKLGERGLDGIEHRISQSVWFDISPRLERLAKMLARKIARH